jgi:hypothetical protein
MTFLRVLNFILKVKRELFIVEIGEIGEIVIFRAKKRKKNN